MKYARRADTGFTLIELIVVMLIMTSVLMISAPRIAGRSESAALRATAAEFQALASAARAKAVLQQRTISLVIDSEEQSISLLALAPLASQDKQTLKDTRGTLESTLERTLASTGESVSRTRSLPAGMSADFKASNETVEHMQFLPDGSADQGTLLISNSRDQRLSMQLVAATGRLQLADTE